MILSFFKVSTLSKSSNDFVLGFDLYINVVLVVDLQNYTNNKKRININRQFHKKRKENENVFIYTCVTLNSNDNLPHFFCLKRNIDKIKARTSNLDSEV